MTELRAFTGARIFDGEAWHDDAVLVVAGERVVDIGPEVPADAGRVALDGGILAPGFIDLQVNGGDGVLFNARPDVEAIETICRAHLRSGVTGCLPTLITDTPDVTDLAVEAGIAAARSAVPGFLGLHLEGPHLSLTRKGAHDPALIRPLSDNDLLRLAHARSGMPAVLTTLAAETVGPEQIAAIVAAGVVVSIGHSDATYAEVADAARAGATMVTHLFNAQSQMTNREPGVVGAALDIGELHAGLIADGIHVHPASMSAALRAKRGPGRIFLVTDAMSVTGTDLAGFTLNGRTVYRRDGALRLADGTLAGADLTMIDAVAYAHRALGLPLGEALRMASLYPAAAMGLARDRGHLKRGARADLVHISDDLAVRRTFVGGHEAHVGAHPARL